MAVYEGAWDCPHCGNVANRGPDKHCPACGSGRGADVKIYLPENAREVQEEAELARANAGPDWSCSYCQVDNWATARFCVNCGAGQDGSAPRPVVDTLYTKPAEEPKPGTRSYRKLLLGCVGLPLLLLFLLIWMAMPSKADLKVVGHAWQRVIHSEDYRKVDESDWDNAVPAGAEVQRTSREIHHYNKVQIGTERKTRTKSERVQVGSERVKVGTRNKGNGYFEDVYENRPKYETRTSTETYSEPVYRDDPVYRTKVYYKIWKWVPGSDATAAGQDLNPRWPDFQADPKQHREHGREEHYEVKLVDAKKNKPYSYEAKSEVEWRQFQDGQTYPGKVSRSKCVELKSSKS